MKKDHKFKLDRAALFALLCVFWVHVQISAQSPISTGQILLLDDKRSPKLFFFFKLEMKEINSLTDANTLNKAVNIFVFCNIFQWDCQVLLAALSLN